MEHFTEALSHHKFGEDTIYGGCLVSQPNSEPRIVASVSGGNWSYLTHLKSGKSLRITLNGYGSCTPAGVLQAWVDGMSLADRIKLSKRIDRSGDRYD